MSKARDTREQGAEFLLQTWSHFGHCPASWHCPFPALLRENKLHLWKALPLEGGGESSL